MKPDASPAPAGAIVTAAIGCLQPGIDPVFLTLLSDASGLDPHAHGWIVGATQGGMAAGALLVWRCRAFLPARASQWAALAAAAFGLATAVIDHDPLSLLLVRCLYGGAMGVIYTEAMSTAALHRPTGSYAAVFLTQLLLSSIVAALLPLVAHAAGPRIALSLLALAPAFAAVLATHARPAPRPDGTTASAEDADDEIAPAAWALAFATFAFIAATMMVWSSTGALAMDSGIDRNTLGVAVSAGSVIGTVTALAVLRERRLLPLPLTGVAAGIGLLAPLALTPSGDAALFVVAILLLNVASTAIIVRCSGAASAAAQGALFRRFVACTHPLGMIAGPVLGAVLSASAGLVALEAGAFAVVTAGCTALIVATSAARPRGISAGDGAVA